MQPSRHEERAREMLQIEADVSRLSLTLSHRLPVLAELGKCVRRARSHTTRLLDLLKDDLIAHTGDAAAYRASVRVGPRAIRRCHPAEPVPMPGLDERGRGKPRPTPEMLAAARDMLAEHRDALRALPLGKGRTDKEICYVRDAAVAAIEAAIDACV